MFKWYAEFFKMTEKQMTRKSLNRLKLITLIAVPAAPLIILDAFGTFSSMSGEVKFAMMIVPIIAFLIVSFSKFANRFLVPNRFLDEWEIARKQEAMAFSYQCLIYTSMAAMLFCMAYSYVNKAEGIQFGPIGFAETTFIMLGIFTLLLYIVHIYLLFTVKPIDDIADESVSA